MEPGCIAGHLPELRRECVSGESGPSPLPCFFPMLCLRRETVLSALPALCRYFPWRTFQYRVLRPACPDAGTGLWVSAGGIYPYLRGRTHLQQPPRADTTAVEQGAQAASHHAAE